MILDMDSSTVEVGISATIQWEYGTPVALQTGKVGLGLGGPVKENIILRASAGPQTIRLTGTADQKE